MIGYLVLTGKMQPSYSTFKGVFKGKSHFLIPVGLTALMIMDNKWTKAKTSDFINDQRNARNIDIAIRKFLCETNNKERVIVFGQS